MKREQFAADLAAEFIDRGFDPLRRIALPAFELARVRFPLRDRSSEYLLVWTTTPWTLTSNVAAAVSPGLRYLKIAHRDEIYYLAKGALKQAAKGKDLYGVSEP